MGFPIRYPICVGAVTRALDFLKPSQSELNLRKPLPERRLEIRPAERIFKGI